jgi:GNAT superfamily N-acetyltransferase
MIVEVTTESDLKELQDVMIEFYKIMPYKRLIKGSEEFQEASDLWIENWFFMIGGGLGKILALKEDNNFIGAIGLVVTPSLEDGVMTCMEAFWYVDENHRGQGLKLLIKGQKVAKEMGAKRMVMMFLENSMPEKVKNVYERMGYNLIQTSYFKEL